MFRLAHISDIHLGPLPKISLSELASKRITGYVNWHRNRGKHLFGTTLDTVTDSIKALGVDHVAITGDIVNLATRTEIETARTWLETEFEPAQTTLVPGNHDAYVPNALKRVIRSWRPWMLSGAEDDGESSPFPTMARRGPVALIGISTANATMPFMASGDLSKKQIRAAGRLLDEAGRQGLFRVVLIHHPPVRGAAAWHKRLKGIGRFRDMLLEHGAELVLHGHTHLDTLYELEGRDGPVPVVGISSASQGLGGHKPPAGFNLFEISGEQGAWQLGHKRYHLGPDAESMVENPVAVIGGPESEKIED